MYKNYIFDLYGTLIDINTEEDSMELWYKLSLFYTFKGAEYTAEELKESYVHKVNTMKESFTNTNYPDFPLEAIFQEIYEDRNVSPSDEIVTSTAQFFRILSIKYIKLYDGAIELLELLKSKNKNIYLLSNAQRVFTLYEMKLFGIDKYFDDIFFSSDYKICKPERKFYDALLNKHNLDIKDSIMIGNDATADIKGATNVGLNSVYLHSNLSPDLEEELTSTYTFMEMDLNKVMNTIVK